MLELERFNGWIYSWHWTDRDSDGLNRSDLNRSDLLILWILSKAIVHKNIWMCYVLPSISMMNHVESNILRMCICIRTEEVEKFFNNWTSGSKEPFLEMEKWRTPRNGKVSAKTGKKRNMPQNRPVWRACCRFMWASLDKKETCETRKSINVFVGGTDHVGCSWTGGFPFRNGLKLLQSIESTSLLFASSSTWYSLMALESTALAVANLIHQNVLRSWEDFNFPTDPPCDVRWSITDFGALWLFRLEEVKRWESGSPYILIPPSKKRDITTQSSSYPKFIHIHSISKNTCNIIIEEKTS